MTQEERTRLESIDTILRSETVRKQIRPIIERVHAELARKNEALMTWEPIPLTVFGHALPSEIRSAWVFALRAGADTGAERHPNSHQRMMTFQGSGDIRPESRASGNRMCWSAIRTRRWNSAGFQFHRMPGIARWFAKAGIGRWFRFTLFRPRN